MKKVGLQKKEERDERRKRMANLLSSEQRRRHHAQRINWGCCCCKNEIPTISPHYVDIMNGCLRRTLDNNNHRKHMLYFSALRRRL